MGVMLYFGGEGDNLNEAQYKQKMLEHVINGLKTVQHNGSILLKVYETYSAFTVSLIYILYSLFESVFITKPWGSSFASHS